MKDAPGPHLSIHILSLSLISLLLYWLWYPGILYILATTNIYTIYLLVIFLKWCHMLLIHVQCTITSSTVDYRLYLLYYYLRLCFCMVLVWNKYMEKCPSPSFLLPPLLPELARGASEQQISSALGRRAAVACCNADCQSDTVGGQHNASLFRQALLCPTSPPRHRSLSPFFSSRGFIKP